MYSDFERLCVWTWSATLTSSPLAVEVRTAVTTPRGVGVFTPPPPVTGLPGSVHTTLLALSARSMRTSDLCRNKSHPLKNISNYWQQNEIVWHWNVSCLWDFRTAFLEVFCTFGRFGAIPTDKLHQTPAAVIKSNNPKIKASTPTSQEPNSVFDKAQQA